MSDRMPDKKVREIQRNFRTHVRSSVRIYIYIIIYTCRNICPIKCQMFLSEFMSICQLVGVTGRTYFVFLFAFQWVWYWMLILFDSECKLKWGRDTHSWPDRVFLLKTKDNTVVALEWVILCFLKSTTCWKTHVSHLFMWFLDRKFDEKSESEARAQDWKYFTQIYL